MTDSLSRTVPFDPANPKAALLQLPPRSAVFALYGEEARFEPYIGRTPNLRARLERLLLPSAKHPRRLQLAGRVRRIEYRLTGSDFESLLLQFDLLQNVYGPKSPNQSLERMHLGAPSFVRFLGSNPYPRITVTNRPSQREAAWAYGPFPSRAAAERYADEALKLFLLRRCTDDLAPHPSHPGCVYSEMKMCLAPCYQGCTDERYAEESAAVQSFLATRGDSRLVILKAQRDQASANLEFESAAQLHAQVQRVESVRALASELVRPLAQLRAVILQASANPDEVAVFLFENGRLRGAAPFSTLGMRIQNEQSGSTSLFAHPMSIEPIPEEPAVSVQRSGNRDQGSEISPIPSQQYPSQQIPAHQVVPAPGSSRPETTPQNNAPLQTAEEPNPAQNQEGFVTGHDRVPSGCRAETAPQKEGALAPEKEPSSLKGTGFSPYINPSTSAGALAPEGAHTSIPTEFGPSSSAAAPPAKLPRTLLESRLEAALASLDNPEAAPSATVRQAHLALLKRWYYRPEARRTGEIFFPDPEGRWPIRPILRGIGRVYSSKFKPPPD